MTQQIPISENYLWHLEIVKMFIDCQSLTGRPYGGHGYLPNADEQLVWPRKEKK